VTFFPFRSSFVGGDGRQAGELKQNKLAHNNDVEELSLAALVG
jgi:hypothetical protein